MLKNNHLTFPKYVFLFILTTFLFAATSLVSAESATPTLPPASAPVLPPAPVPAPAPLPPSRYEDIHFEDSVIAQFDKETFKYVKDPYKNELLIDVWIKTFPETTRVAYSLNHYLFQLNDRKMMSLELIDFNSNGRILSTTSNKYAPERWNLIIPETLAEKWYESIYKYAQQNDKKLKADYEKRKKAPDEKSSNSLLAPFTRIINLLSNHGS